MYEFVPPVCRTELLTIIVQLSQYFTKTAKNQTFLIVHQILYNNDEKIQISHCFSFPPLQKKVKMSVNVQISHCFPIDIFLPRHLGYYKNVGAN